MFQNFDENGKLKTQSASSVRPTQLTWMQSGGCCMPAGHSGNLWEEALAQPGRVPGAGFAGLASLWAGYTESASHRDLRAVRASALPEPRRGCCVHTWPG